MNRPDIGRAVIYRSKTGRYAVPAIITATMTTLYAPAVEGGHIPALSSDMHVHLTVLTPGTPGERLPDTDPSIGAQSTPAGGTCQEWDIGFAEQSNVSPDGTTQPPGTWAWPARS